MVASDCLFAWAQGAALLLAQSGTTATPRPASPGQDMRTLVFMFAALAIVYVFMVMRPQRTEQKKRQSMLDAVAKGDHIVTIGGIHGRVEAVDLSKGILSVEIAPKTTIRLNKSSLASVTPKAKVAQDKSETNGQEDKPKDEKAKAEKAK